MRSLRSLLPLVAFALAASCSDSGPFVPNIATANFAPALGVDIENSVLTPSGVYYRDIQVGGGALIPASGSVHVTNGYEGYLRSGVKFDDGSFDFNTGMSEVIAGYDIGVRGMRQGGVRQIIIPPSLGYGSQRNGSIPGNSILVFFVTVTGVN
jgi:FKBP-type peptidyl-prolyl cis-trans isomerase